jgi:hypothetical protein
LLLAVLAVYAVLLAASPLLHHDVACHLTSPTHCTGAPERFAPGGRSPPA